MTPNVRAAAGWIMEHTRYIATVNLRRGKARLYAWDEDGKLEPTKFLTYAELIEFARELGYVPEPEAKENA